MVSLKMAQDDYNEQEIELLKDKRKLKSQQKEQEMAHQDDIQTICMVRGAEDSIQSHANLILTFQVMTEDDRGGERVNCWLFTPGAGLLSADRGTCALEGLILTLAGMHHG